MVRVVEVPWQVFKRDYEPLEGIRDPLQKDEYHFKGERGCMREDQKCRTEQFHPKKERHLISVPVHSIPGQPGKEAHETAIPEEILMKVTKEQIRKARHACLWRYLLETYPEEFRMNGDNVVSKTNGFFSVPKSVNGYNDFVSSDHGNPIDFLVKHKGFVFQDAVMELCRFEDKSAGESAVPDGAPLILPRAADTHEHVIEFLKSCFVPEDFTEELIDEGFLYEDVYRNAVFVTPQKDCYEALGTGSGKYYRCKKTKDNRFWYVPCERPLVNAYVCLTAMDAIFLYLLKRSCFEAEAAVFVSSGSVGKENVVCRLMKELTVVPAFRDTLQIPSTEENLLPPILPEKGAWKDDYLNII